MIRVDSVAGGVMSWSPPAVLLQDVADGEVRALLEWACAGNGRLADPGCDDMCGVLS
jgi:hypothetical protein